MSEDKGGKDQIVEFTCGPLTVKQKGVLLVLEHPKYGRTFLIDITDSDDPTTKDLDDPNSQAEKVSDLMGKYTTNPQFEDTFCFNNGVIAVITGKLTPNPEEKMRTYIGLATIDPSDTAQKELVSYSLDSAGFKSNSFYVPFSFDSSLVRQNMAKLIVNSSGIATQTDMGRLTESNSLT